MLQTVHSPICAVHIANKLCLMAGHIFAVSWHHCKQRAAAWPGAGEKYPGVWFQRHSALFSCNPTDQPLFSRLNVNAAGGMWFDATS
jgi:hypothetical protein